MVGVGSIWPTSPHYPRPRRCSCRGDRLRLSRDTALTAARERRPQGARSSEALLAPPVQPGVAHLANIAAVVRRNGIHARNRRQRPDPKRRPIFQIAQHGGNGCLAQSNDRLESRMVDDLACIGKKLGIRLPLGFEPRRKRCSTLSAVGIRGGSWTGVVAVTVSPNRDLH